MYLNVSLQDFVNGLSLDDFHTVERLLSQRMGIIEGYPKPKLTKNRFGDIKEYCDKYRVDLRTSKFIIDLETFRSQIPG